MSEKTILCVDDSEFDRRLLMGALSRKGGYRVREASNGAECIEFLEKESVDLILLDIMMPDETGVRLLERIRERRNEIDLPVIMVTAKDETGDIVECLQRGANDYVTKPVNFEVALSRVETHLRLADLSRAISRFRESAAIDAMITTYNHEINNPLAIALLYLERGLEDARARERATLALWRIAEIVRKIRELSDQKELEYRTYSQHARMLKL